MKFHHEPCTHISYGPCTRLHARRALHPDGDAAGDTPLLGYYRTLQSSPVVRSPYSSRNATTSRTCTKSPTRNGQVQAPQSTQHPQQRLASAQVNTKSECPKIWGLVPKVLVQRTTALERERLARLITQHSEVRLQTPVWQADSWWHERCSSRRNDADASTHKRRGGGS